MTTQVTAQAFRCGMSWERKGIFRGNLCVEQSEEGIVEIIQNLIDFALEDNLTEELLRQDANIVVGFALDHPEVFTVLAGGNRCPLKTEADISPRSGRNISETTSVAGTNSTRRSGSPGCMRERRQERRLSTATSRI